LATKGNKVTAKKVIEVTDVKGLLKWRKCKFVGL